MSARAIFGPPRKTPDLGGLQVAVYLVPVYEDRLLTFDVTAPEAHGRWLPWAVIGYGQNPYEAAAMLADDWLDVPLEDLSLVDVLSFDAPGGGWELAIIFRACLWTKPAGDETRTPHLYAAGEFDAIASFDPVDLERWVTGGPASPARATPAQAKLLF